jgi:hypothetical protein
MASLALGVRFNPVSAGAADFVFSTAVTGYRSPVAGLTNSKVYRYRAESADLSQWEYGVGIWSSATNTLARNTVSFSSTGSKINFTVQPQVSITLDVPDVLQFDDAMALTTAQQTMGRSNLGVFVQGYLFGLTLSTAGASATFSVSAGQAADSTGIDVMVLAASISKTTSAWAVGTGNGALDTGAIANSTWYHVYLIKRTDTGVVDVLVSLSATTPTMPASYAEKRRIGSLRTNTSGQWTLFTQLSDEFLWSVPVGDVNVVTLSTTATLFALTVPTGLQVVARMRGLLSPGGASRFMLLNSPDEATAVANAVPGNLTADASTSGSPVGAIFTLDVRTNTSGQIRAVASAGANNALQIATYGWLDRRGQDF